MSDYKSSWLRVVIERHVGRWLDKLWDWKSSFQLWFLKTKRIARRSDRSSHDTSRMRLFKNPRSLFPVGLGKYINPLSWMKWSLEFATDWLLSRRVRSIVAALPAIAFLVCLPVLVLVANRHESHRAKVYQLKSLRLSMQPHSARKQIVADELYRLHPEAGESLYSKAREAEAAQKLGLARVLMGDAAKELHSGTAALWLINDGFDLSNISHWQSKECNEFLNLMSIALKGLNRESLTAAQKIMVGYLKERESFGEAIALYDQIVESDPGIANEAAELCWLQGNKSQAQAFAKIAENFFESESRRHPSDNALKELAKAMVFLDRESEAADILFSRYQETHDQEILAAHSMALLRWVERLSLTNRDSSIGERLNILWQTAVRDPHNMFVLRAVIECLSEEAPTRTEEQVVIRNSLEKGVTADLEGFIPGAVALVQGKKQTANDLFSQATSLGTDCASMLNQLAITELSIPNSNLNLAEQFSEFAVEFRGNYAPFLLTRGIVRLRLQNYLGAIDDLERCLQLPELAGEAHRQLATAYRALGQDQLANEHAKAAE
ncbi:MAG: hypothetical protein KDB03_25615 [Planctomycetales bacterium]|nr:hypothetical protein [Planctomycetales bacterium]